MPEYIDREALISDLKDLPEQERIEYMGIYDLVKSQTTVEVVSCKDCAHYGGITFGNICRRWSGLNVKNCTKPDDYCSYGERKEGDEK